MTTTTRLSLLLLVAAAHGCATAPAAPDLARARFVELTHVFSRETLFWPTEEEGFVLEPVFKGTTEGGYHYEANRFRSAEHGGTHMDAPAHFAAGGDTTDAVPLERLVAPAVRVDVRDACARDRDHAVSRADLAAFEAAHGAIPTGAIVLLDTGFAERWPDRARYLGTAEHGAPATAHLHFPGLSAQAARWLAEERRIAAVGIDTASIDPGPSRDFSAHRELSAHGVPAFENLASLGDLPPRDFWVIALPMRIAGGSGGPLRAIAVLR
jgi:kynurenine formamidase